MKADISLQKKKNSRRKYREGLQKGGPEGRGNARQYSWLPSGRMKNRDKGEENASFQKKNSVIGNAEEPTPFFQRYEEGSTYWRGKGTTVGN